jgi:hypothetical protein
MFMFEVYYLSIAYQAAYHTSATGAGVKLLPFILVQIAVLILSSRIIPIIGRFKWVIVAGPVFLAIGSGLLYTVKYGTPESHLYGFQVFLGIGIGLSLQNMMLAVQFELKNEPWLISAGTGLSVFSESDRARHTFVHSHTRTHLRILPHPPQIPLTLGTPY